MPFRLSVGSTQEVVPKSSGPCSRRSQQSTWGYASRAWQAVRAGNRDFMIETHSASPEVDSGRQPNCAASSLLKRKR